MSRFLIVDSKILPDYFQKVLDVRLKAKENPEISISALCEEAGISRSTYYKYKDHIYDSASEMSNRRAEIQMLVNHKQGVLKTILETISQNGGNILTIHQSAPINDSATLSLQIDVSHVDVEISELVLRLSKIKDVRKARLISIE